MRRPARRSLLTRSLALLAVLACALTPAVAQATPTTAPASSFWVTNGTVETIAPSGSGSLFLGGAFDYVGPITGAGARIATADAAVSLGLSVNATIRAAVSDGAGGVFIGGDFTEVDGRPRARLAHIKGDGTLDLDWNPGADGPVHAIVTNGVSVWIGGSFTTVGGQPRRNLAQVLAGDGSPTTFVADTNATGTVRALGLFTSTLVVGGDYTSIGGVARKGLAVLGANTAAVLHPVANIEGGKGSVRAFAIIGTTIYLGGDFERIVDAVGTPTPRKNIAAFDGGTLAVYPWDPGADAQVDAVATDGSTIWAGGDFTTTGGAGRSHLAAYTATVAVTNPLIPWRADVAAASGTPSVEALSVTGGKVYAGGSFTSVGGSQRTNLVALGAATGTPDATWRAAAGGTVHTIAPTGSGVFVGGDFISVGGGYRANVAEVSLSTGTLTPWDPRTNGTVRDLAVLSGRVYAAGSFTQAGQPAATRNRLAAFSASTGALEAWDPGADGTVNALAVENGAVYAGGSFTQVAGQPRAGLARIGTDGAPTSFSAAVGGGTVEALALAPLGSTLYVGGSFTTLGGAARAALAAVDSGTGAVRAWAPGADATVRTLAATSSAVYAGGDFLTAGGASRARIAALDPASGTARSFTANADGPVHELALSPTAVYVTGAFGAIGGVARAGLAGVDGDSGALTAWTPTFAPVPGQAVATVGEGVYAGTSVTTLGVANRGLYAYAGTTSGAASSLGCRPYAGSGDGCIEARFPSAFSWGALAPGLRSSPEQPLQVLSNRAWDLVVRSDAANGRFRDWNGSSYGARSFANALTAAVTRLGDPLASPSWSALSSTPPKLLSSAAASDCSSVPETCQQIRAGVTFRQDVSYADAPLTTDTYRIGITYEVVQPF